MPKRPIYPLGFWFWSAFSALTLGLAGCAPLGPLTLPGLPTPCDPVLPGQTTGSVWQQVAPDLWLNQASIDALSTPANGGHISNVVFALDRSGPGPRGWLVGSGPGARAGQALACSIGQQLGAQVTDVISPRAHPESVLGAAGLPDARHWALPEVKAAMTQRCESCLKRLETATHAPAPLVDHVALPTHLIQPPQLGPFDVLRVEVQAQQSVALLQHRTSGVWILPGIVWGRGLVPDLREADAVQLVGVLNQLAALQVTRVLPEQGASADGSLIDDNRDYWTRLLLALKTRWNQGENQPGTASGLTESDRAQASPSARLRDQLNAQRAWQQIENSGFQDQP